jgi:hypothetical protein
MFDSVIICRHCKKEDIVGWHPLWESRNICNVCREKMYEKHGKWMDKLRKDYDGKREVIKRVAR